MRFLNIISASLLFSTIAWSVEKKSSEDVKPVSFIVGPLIGSYVYSEPGVVSHSGFLYGGFARAMYQNSLYRGDLFGQLVTGRLNYDGALCSVSTGNCTPYLAKTNETIANVVHYFQREVSDTPFHVSIGLGYRFLHDRGESSGFYRRTGQYVFAPIGFTYERDVEDWDGRLKLQVHYGWLLQGQMLTQLSDVNSSWGDMTHTQNRGYQYLIQVGLQTRSRPYQWFPEFYNVGFERWSLDASDLTPLVVNGVATADQYFEPKNYSEFMSFSLGWNL